MKLKHVGMIVVSVLAMSSAAVSAAEGDESVTTTVNGGVIHFKGEVVNAACAIDSESMNQTVELGQLPGDRESLFWVNVKAIPAMEKDQKNENTLQLAIISRIKMFYRPTNLAMAPEEAPAMLRFRRSGSKLTLINPTPYFITVTNMKAGNSNLPNTMVPPKGEVSVDITHAATGDISFQTINDYGALTPRIKATMQ